MQVQDFRPLSHQIVKKSLDHENESRVTVLPYCRLNVVTVIWQKIHLLHGRHIENSDCFGHSLIADRPIVAIFLHEEASKMWWCEQTLHLQLSCHFGDRLNESD